jgi:hypothetical protein
MIPSSTVGSDSWGLPNWPPLATQGAPLGKLRSMRSVRTGDHLQAGRHVPKLCLAQSPGEVLADATKVGPGCSTQDLAPLVG